MAKTSNITITEMPYLSSQIMYLSQGTSSDAFAMGDLIESNHATSEASGAGLCKVVNDADKGAFIGVSISTVEAADTLSKVGIALRGVIRALLVTGQTTIYAGECAAWNAGANGTAWNLANTATEPIVHCLDESVVAANYGHFVFDGYSLRAVNDLAFWELPA